MVFYYIERGFGSALSGDLDTGSPPGKRAKQESAQRAAE
jgi:hypothetical protein